MANAELKPPPWLALPVSSIFSQNLWQDCYRKGLPLLTFGIQAASIPVQIMPSISNQFKPVEYITNGQVFLIAKICKNVS